MFFFGGAKIRKNLIWLRTKRQKVRKKSAPFIQITNKIEIMITGCRRTRTHVLGTLLAFHVFPHYTTIRQVSLSVVHRFGSVLHRTSLCKQICQRHPLCYPWNDVHLQYKKTFKENSASSIDLKSPSYSVLFLFEFPRFYCFLIFSANAANRSASLTMQFGSSWKSKSAPWLSME